MSQIRRIAKKNRMGSVKSVKTKVMGPLIMREGGKKKGGGGLTVGQIKLCMYSTERCQVACELVVLSQRGKGKKSGVR